MVRKIKLILLILFGFLIPVSFILAESCPNMTTVSGTDVTFVGELTDMGGDSTTAVWFEYGQTSNYGQKTLEKNLTQPGIYCINLSNLSPCTTYHYRAGARNSAGTSYGEDKTFTTTCQSALFLTKLVRNLSDGTQWTDSVLADPKEILSFWIQVKNTGSSLIQNVIVRDTLPSKINFTGELKIDGIAVSGDIISGLNIGNLSPNQTKTITFNAEVAGPEQFSFGDTQLTNTAFASSLNVSASDTARVIVQKKPVSGVTTVPTGLTNNLFLDSFFLPLIISLIIIFLFRSHLIKWEEWLDKRKKEYRNYKVKKLLQFKIAKIRLKGLLTKGFGKE